MAKPKVAPALKKRQARREIPVVDVSFSLAHVPGSDKPVILPGELVRRVLWWFVETQNRETDWNWPGNWTWRIKSLGQIMEAAGNGTPECHEEEFATINEMIRDYAERINHSSPSDLNHPATAARERADATITLAQAIRAKAVA